MTWQDAAFAFTAWLAIVTAIPMIRSPHKKPPISSCLLTILIIAINETAFISQGFYMTAVPMAILGAQWLVITKQRYHIDGHPPLPMIWKECREILSFS